MEDKKNKRGRKTGCDMRAQGLPGGCNPQYFYIRHRKIFIEVKGVQKRQVEHGLNVAGSGILREDVGGLMGVVGGGAE